MGKNSRRIREPVPTLRRWREVNNLSRQEVVDIINALDAAAPPMAQSTIGKWETGENSVTLQDLKLLAQIYKTTPDRLLFDPSDNVTPELMKKAFSILETKAPEAVKAWLASGEYLPEAQPSQLENT